MFKVKGIQPNFSAYEMEEGKQEPRNVRKLTKLGMAYKLTAMKETGISTM